MNVCLLITYLSTNNSIIITKRQFHHNKQLKNTANVIATFWKSSREILGGLFSHRYIIYTTCIVPHADLSSHLCVFSQKWRKALHVRQLPYQTQANIRLSKSLLRATGDSFKYSFKNKRLFHGKWKMCYEKCEKINLVISFTQDTHSFVTHCQRGHFGHVRIRLPTHQYDHQPQSLHLSCFLSLFLFVVLFHPGPCMSLHLRPFLNSPFHTIHVPFRGPWSPSTELWGKVATVFSIDNPQTLGTHCVRQPGEGRSEECWVLQAERERGEREKERERGRHRERTEEFGIMGWRENRKGGT